MPRRVLFFIVCSLLLLGMVLPIAAQDTPEDMQDTTFVPIGGGYTDTFEGFLQAALPNVTGDEFYILMLPLAFSYDAEDLTADDLIINTQDADRRRDQLEDACEAIAPEGVRCNVDVAPIYTNEAAQSEAVLDYMRDDLAAVYFTGGDQQIAMQILANTPLEQALADAYARGVVLGGNSAGLAIQGRYMIAGYSSEDYESFNALQDGAVDLWMGETRRGFAFGLTNVLLDQHFWEYARLPRVLNALAQPDVPTVAIGVDGFTGATITNESLLGEVFGLYTAIVFDADTLGAAANANFDNDNILSIRNVLVHMLSPGDFTYDIDTRTHSLAAPLAEATSDYALSLPQGAGSLTLTGNILNYVDNSNTLKGVLFTAGERVLILTTAYGSEDDAAVSAETLRGFAGLGDITTGTLADDLDYSAYDAIIITGDDQSMLDVAALQPVADALLAGTDVIADHATAVAFGTYYAAHPPTPEDSRDYEDAVQGALLQGNTTIAEGLGILDGSFEVRVADDANLGNRWGRLFALAYNNPQTAAYGLADDTVLVIRPEGATVTGDNGLFVLDLSQATLDLGTNDGFAFANGLMHVFAPSETLD